MLDFRRHSHIAFLCSLAFGVTGCAADHSVMRPEQLQQGIPIKLLVTESPIEIDSRRLRAVLTPETKQPSPASERLVSEGKQHARDYALTSMKTTLGMHARVIVAPPAEESALFKEIQGGVIESAMSQEEANRIRAVTGADAVVRFRITDYGLTPKSWQKGYITFEVTATLALAAVIAYSSIPAAKAAAGVYLVQETVEETAEGYAGFWALNKVSRPVRIEAELVRLNPAAIVRKTSRTGLADTRLSHLTKKISPEERNHQLDKATDYAVQKVVADLAADIKDIQ